MKLSGLQEDAGKGEAPWPPSLLVRGQLYESGKRWRSACISLHGLLDYDEEDKEEGAFEINLFAEHFSEMLARDYGLVILSALYAERYAFMSRTEHCFPIMRGSHKRSPWFLLEEVITRKLSLFVLLALIDDSSFPFLWLQKLG